MSFIQLYSLWNLFVLKLPGVFESEKQNSCFILWDYLILWNVWTFVLHMKFIIFIQVIFGLYDIYYISRKKLNGRIYGISGMFLFLKLLKFYGMHKVYGLCGMGVFHVT